ncbi:MAG: hypothetical protein ACXWBQ_20365, partial [Usitatibacter sp.]
MGSAWRNILAAAAFSTALPAMAQANDPSAAIVQSKRADREAWLAAGAKKEGQVVVYTSLISEDLAALSSAFEGKYGVKVSGWRASSEKVQQRALVEAKAHRDDVDVIETNGPELEGLYREKILQPIASPHLKSLMPQAIRPHGQWVGTRINMFVQMYNTKLVTKEELPRT